MFYVKIKIIYYTQKYYERFLNLKYEIEANISGIKLFARNDYVQFWCNIKL